jgi:hypothetical protein
MNAQITELFDRLSAKERTDLLAGLKRLDQRRSAEDALMTASLLESQLKLLGLREYAERVADIQEHIRDLI